MREINFTKQKILIVGLVGVFVLAVVMLVVMFLGGKSKNSLGSKGKVENVKNNNEDKKPKGSDNTVADKNNGQGKQDDIGENVNKKIAKLTPGKIFGLSIKKGTNLAMFYEQQKVLTIDPYSGKKNSLGTYPFGDVRKFLWNSSSDKAIVNDTGEYYVYDLNSNLTHRFRDTIDTAIWNKSGDKVIYKYYNSKTHKRKIRIADINGENSQLVVDNLPYRKVDLQLQPLSDRVCYYPMPDARIKGKLFCYNLDGKNPKEYGGNFGQDYLWSPMGDKILTSFSKEESGNQLVLAVMNKNGGQAKGLSFATTVKKCVWAKNNIDVYCAMIGGAPLDVMLPNGWQEQIFNSADTFWKINTETGKKTRLLELEEIPTVIDAEDLTLDPEENFLFFKARRDGSLWRIRVR